MSDTQVQTGKGPGIWFIVNLILFVIELVILFVGKQWILLSSLAFIWNVIVVLGMLISGIATVRNKNSTRLQRITVILTFLVVGVIACISVLVFAGPSLGDIFQNTYQSLITPTP